MVDMTKYVLDFFAPAALRDHIFDDRGGNSLLHLQAMLQDDSEIKMVDGTAKAHEAFLQYGPLLVSTMQMNEDFMPGRGTLCHEGQPKGAFLLDANRLSATHAMVVVGTRRDETTGKVRATLARVHFCRS
jgi:hypothetical protein